MSVTECSSGQEILGRSLTQLQSLVSALSVLFGKQFAHLKRDWRTFPGVRGLTRENHCLTLAGYLLLRHGGHRRPTLRQLPWYPDRIISGMTFDPSGTWLLTATTKGNLYVVPALALLVSRICWLCLCFAFSTSNTPFLCNCEVLGPLRVR